MTLSNFRPTRVGGPLKAHVEAPSVGGTKGHRVDQSGLRGHSVDDETYPWRVVGVGTAWEVHDVHGRRHRRGDVYLAHAQARALKLLYPAGCIEGGPTGPKNIGGPADTIPQRLAGLKFAVCWEHTGRVYHFQAAVTQDVPGSVRVTSQDTAADSIDAHYLAENQHIAVALDLAPFYKSKPVEIEP